MTNDNQDALRCADRTSEICTALRSRPVPLADYIPHIQAQADHLRRLVAENEAKDALLRQAEQDAARYRWLRNASPEERNRLEHYAADALDVATDAAIRQHLEGRA